MRILFVTDAWHPQINGVVRTIQTTAAELEAMGHTVDVIGPDRFATIPMPGYREIRLALLPGVKLGHLIDDFAPDAIHIATEGPLGWAARDYCLAREIQYTTSYHTRFPEYIKKRMPIPLSWSYRWLRLFHAPSSAVMVATESIERGLRGRGFTHIRRWGRGVDTTLFQPRDKSLVEAYRDLPRPILLYVGRLAVEKNVEAFLRLDVPGSKVLIGDGPSAAILRGRYPRAHFLGSKTGEDLALHYAGADLFVFPSRTDTFGLVVLEALACGVPVAAFPVPGPLDILGADGSGVAGVDADLAKAVITGLNADPAACRRFAEQRSWRACAHEFLTNLDPFDPEKIKTPPVD